MQGMIHEATHYVMHPPDYNATDIAGTMSTADIPCDTANRGFLGAKSLAECKAACNTLGNACWGIYGRMDPGNPDLVGTACWTCPFGTPETNHNVNGYPYWAKALWISVAAASGRAYRVATSFDVGEFTMTDRTYTFTSLGSFTESNGFSYIRVANDDKDTPSDQLQYTLTSMVGFKVYLIYYNGQENQHTNKRPWISNEGWEVDNDLIKPAWSVSTSMTEVRSKTFPDGSASVKGHNGQGWGVPLVFVTQATATTPATAAERAAFLQSVAGVWPTIVGQPNTTMTIQSDGNYTVRGTSGHLVATGTNRAYDKVTINGVTYFQTERYFTWVHNGITEGPWYSVVGLNGGNLWESPEGSWTGTPVLSASGRTLAATGCRNFGFCWDSNVVSYVE
jgi:hypothetical protein